MADLLTLELVKIEVVKEAIKFLYGQATEALKRWRDRKQAKEAAEEVPTENAVPAIFQGQVSLPVIHLEAVGKLETQLDDVCDDLARYESGRKEVTLDNRPLLEEVDALRQMLEAIYRQRLTFQGEQRPASGPVVETEVKVETVAGYVAGVRARAIQSGFVRSRVEVKHIGEGGEVVGVDADTIGQR